MLKAVECRGNLPPLSPRDNAARNIAEVLNFQNPPNPTALRWSVPTVLGAPCGAGSTADYERG
jgi:phospholipase C